MFQIYTLDAFLLGIFQRMEAGLIVIKVNENLENDENIMHIQIHYLDRREK